MFNVSIPIYSNSVIRLISRMRICKNIENMEEYLVCFPLKYNWMPRKRNNKAELNFIVALPGIRLNTAGSLLNQPIITIALTRLVVIAISNLRPDPL
jgi:hypothetical protein